MATTFNVRIDARPVEALAGRLERLASGAQFRFAAAEAVNAVVDRWQPRIAREMNAGLNLSDQYVTSRMRSTPATAIGAGAVRSEITTRGDLTIIGHYPHQQLRRAGTSVRSGTSAGRRPSGVTVEIKKGAPVTESQWFTMRLRAGTASGDRVGLFVRTSGGRVKHLYGVSPYSLFRFQIGRFDEDVAADLATTALERTAAVAERIVP